MLISTCIFYRAHCTLILHIDQGRQHLEFKMGAKVFVRVSPYKHVIRFDRKDKLALRFVGPFEVLEGTNKVSYQLVLLANMNCIHNVFYVSLLHKYISEPTMC